MTQTMNVTIETADQTITYTRTVMRGKVESEKAKVRAGAPAGSTVTISIA